MKPLLAHIFILGSSFFGALAQASPLEDFTFEPSAFCVSLTQEYDSEARDPKFNDDTSPATLYLIASLLRECSKDFPEDFYDFLLDEYAVAEKDGVHAAVQTLRSLFRQKVTSELLRIKFKYEAVELVRVRSPLLTPTAKCRELIDQYAALPVEKSYPRGISPAGYELIQELLNECRKGIPVELSSYLVGTYRAQHSTAIHDGIRDVIQVIREQFGKPLKDITLDQFISSQ